MINKSFREHFPVETKSPEETEAFGAGLGKMLAPGIVMALYGELGAGKTHFVRGICSALGVPESLVTSPTFTIVNEYAAPNFPVYHIDAYRIANVAEFFELGYEEYFFDDALCLIEWPERIEQLLPEDTLRLRLSHLGADRRRIELLEDIV